MITRIIKEEIPQANGATITRSYQESIEPKTAKEAMDFLGIEQVDVTSQWDYKSGTQAAFVIIKPKADAANPAVPHDIGTRVILKNGKAVLPPINCPLPHFNGKIGLGERTWLEYETDYERTLPSGEKVKDTMIVDDIIGKSDWAKKAKENLAKGLTEGKYKYRVVRGPRMWIPREIYFSLNVLLTLVMKENNGLAVNKETKPEVIDSNHRKISKHNKVASEAKAVDAISEVKADNATVKPGTKIPF